MAWTKIWIGTTGDYSLRTNWTKISIRNSAYSWTASGSGTNEYYLRTAASGDPGIGGQPGGVWINGTDQAEGTVGSLANLGWDYADNDALGYSTIYIRLNAGDPDSQTTDYVQFQSIPVATDNVRIPRGSGTITSGLDQSAVAINAFIVEKGYAAAIGSATGYLKIDPDSLSFDSTGAAYIDIGSAAIDVEIRNTATAASGYRGIYLKGTAIDVLNVMNGNVGLAAQAGEVSTVDNIKISNASNASLYLGSGVTVSTGADLFSGTLESASTIPTTNLYGGTLEAVLAAALTTVNLKGGTLYHSGSGTLGTLNCYAGVADWTRSGTERTVTTINCYKGGSYTLRINRPSVTYTNNFTLAESVTFAAS